MLKYVINILRNALALARAMSKIVRDFIQLIHRNILIAKHDRNASYADIQMKNKVKFLRDQYNYLRNNGQL